MSRIFLFIRIFFYYHVIPYFMLTQMIFFAYHLYILLFSLDKCNGLCCSNASWRQLSIKRPSYSCDVSRDLHQYLKLRRIVRPVSGKAEETFCSFFLKQKIDWIWIPRSRELKTRTAKIRSLSVWARRSGGYQSSRPLVSLWMSLPNCPYKTGPLPAQATLPNVDHYLSVLVEAQSNKRSGRTSAWTRNSKTLGGSAAPDSLQYR